MKKQVKSEKMRMNIKVGSEGESRPGQKKGNREQRRKDK